MRRLARTAGGGWQGALYLLAIVASVLSAPRAARANGRYPKADQLQVAPDDPELLAVRTTFGLLLSRDSGRNWDWVCERAIGYSGVQDPTLGLMQAGTLIASLSEGIARSTDYGCSWAFSEARLGGSPVIDLTVRKDAPTHALALVWDAQQQGYSSRIIASTDNGRTFSPYGTAIDPTVLVTTIDVAPSNGHRVYASGTRSVDGARSALLFGSDDDGEHWSEYSLPFDPKLEQGVYIAAIDPADADTVYLRTSSATAGRLLVTHDGGQHVSAVYSGSLLSFALSPDGKRLYFGGEDGLHSATAGASKIEQRARVRVLCLFATADTVYACSDEHSGFTVGASTDGGFTFQPLLHLDTVRGPLSCNAGECDGDWPVVRAQLGIPLPTESGAGANAGADSNAGAGNADGGSAAGTPDSQGGAPNPSVEPQLTPKGSCAVAFGNSGGTLCWEMLLLAAAGALTRRRRTSPVQSRPPAK